MEGDKNPESKSMPKYKKFCHNVKYKKFCHNVKYKKFCHNDKLI